MPALLVQPSAQLIGVNTQELVNQLQMQLKPHLKLPISFATADAAVLFTVPTLTNGAVGLQIDSLFWEVTTSFTGGTTPSIGASSSNSNYNTKGDLLGAALTAALVSTGLTYKGNTLGGKYSSNGKIVLVAGDTIRFDRIADVFAAGAGFIHVNASYVD